MEGSSTDQGLAGQTSSVSDRSHVVRTKPRHTILMRTRRRSWSTSIFDKDHIDRCSCWVLIFTSIGVFSTLLFVYARKVCMLAFLVSVAFLTIFVLFFEPPDEKLRREAVRNLLFGPRSKKEVEKSDAQGLKVRGKESVRNPLRRASMMYQRYDEVRVPIPVGKTPRDSPKKRTFLKRVWRKLNQRRLQNNPYYSTITEGSTDDGGSEAKKESPSPETPLGRTLEEIECVLTPKRRITFGSVERTADMKSRKPSKPLRKSTGDVDLTRSPKVDRASFAAPGTSFGGLKPIKSAIKSTATRLGSKVRGMESPAVKAYNLSEDDSPKPITRVTGADEFWSVACSSMYVADAKDGPREILKVPKLEPHERGSRQCRSLSELEENMEQRSKTYLVREGEKSFRKVYHVRSV